MKLSKQDADLFFELMWSLQFYVNKQLSLIPDVSSQEVLQRLPTNQKIIVRNALYDNIGLIDDFVKDNPYQLSDDNLAIIDRWKLFISDKFFIERFLKKYTIFIQGKKVYGVLALYDSFEDMISTNLPCYVKAVLLPFKGRIIFDGILESYSIHFGGGISSTIKETYLVARQNGMIIESLDQQSSVSRPQKRKSKDWRPDVDEIISKAEKLHASTGEPAIINQAFGLTKASLEFTQAAIYQPVNLDELWKVLKKVKQAIKKIETTLDRAEQ